MDGHLNTLKDLYEGYLFAVRTHIPKAMKPNDFRGMGHLLDNLIKDIEFRITIIERWIESGEEITPTKIYNLSTALSHRDHPEEFLPRTKEVGEARRKLYALFEELKSETK